MRIGLFGGTFNPVHYGHLRAAEEVREKAGLDKIIFIPAGVPPLKTEEMARAADRLEMTRRAVAGNNFFEVSDIECRKPGKSYTVDTIVELISRMPSDSFFLILGVDAFLELPLWHEPEKLLSLVRFALIPRPGFGLSALSSSPYFEGDGLEMSEGSSVTEIPLRGRTSLLVEVTPLAISSTMIRSGIRDGRSVKYLLPPEIQSFIINRGLYRS